jgi:uncharacterized protein (UPF0147 family)
MSTRSFEQAVQLFQQGQREEAARMFQILVQDAHLPANVRASAYIWLAETNDHVGFKVQCYQQALQLEPNNQDAKMRLDYWMAQQSPPPPSNPTPAPQQGFNPPAPQQSFNPQTPQQSFNPPAPQQSFNPQTPQQASISKRLNRASIHKRLNKASISNASTELQSTNASTRLQSANASTRNLATHRRPTYRCYC